MTKRRSRLAFPLKLIMLVALFMVTVVTVALLISPDAQAKTYASTTAKYIFIYAKNSSDEDILVDILTLKELQDNLSHGQLNEEGVETDYYISYSDNYPTTGYAQARGFTLPELFEYVGAHSSVTGVSGLTFTGTSSAVTDYVDFMATDGAGTYAKSYANDGTKYTYSYDNLYNVDRYYFEGFYNNEITGWTKGWQTGWELNDGWIVEMDDYTGVAYYGDKTDVIATGIPSETILATDVRSGRTTLGGTTSLYEEGFMDQIAANNGIVAGCIKNGLKTDYALNILIPQSEAGIYSGERTAYSNFKWIYTIRLVSESMKDLEAEDTVEPVTADYQLVDGTLTVTLSCATEGAQIYYGLPAKSEESSLLDFKAVPQTLYTGPFPIENVTEEDLETNPVKISAIAVKEGCADAGTVSLQYKQGTPGFNTNSAIALGADLTITANSAVTNDFWNAWADDITSVYMRAPGGEPQKTTEYTVNADKRITFYGSNFTTAGNWDIYIYTNDYAIVSRSVEVKAAPPTVNTEKSYPLYEAITLTFDDQDYQDNADLAIMGPNDTGYTTINSNTLNKSVDGQITINPNYYRASTCKITGTGTYTLRLINSLYTPAEQTVTINISDALPYEETDVYSFDFSEDHYCGNVGDTFTLKLSLSGTKGSFDFYGGTYQLKIDSDYLEVVDDDISTYNLFKYKTDDDGNITFYVNYKTTATQVVGSLDVATIRFRITSDKYGVALSSGDAALYSTYGNLPNTVTGGFAVGGRCSTKNFTDCNTSAWYHQFVDYAVGMGLYAGTSATTFEPLTTMTRGMLVTVMANMSGEDMNAYKGATRFSDVAGGTYYEGPVEWAAAHNIVAGIGEGQFAPDNPVTREQIAVILYQYVTLYLKEDVPTPVGTVYNKFSDIDGASPWAVTALKWATDNGIMNGNSDTTLNPTGNATRAEVATMLRNYQLFFVGIAYLDD